VEAFLYDTSEKELGFRSMKLKLRIHHVCPEEKCNMPFVDYRNSGTGLHVGMFGF